MKRSEMVQKIAAKIASFKGDLPPSRNDDFVASAILTLISEQGMLPPPFTYIPGNPDMPSSLGSGKKHEWESE